MLSNILLVYVTSTTTPDEREIMIIEKKVCFNVSISDPISNKTVSKTICVVIDFHIKNVKPGNDTINVEFPVTINAGNRTITEKVIVLSKIKGEVTKIEVKKVEGGSSETENVIIVVPTPTTTTTPELTTVTKSMTTTIAKPHTTTPQKPVTITKTNPITRTIVKRGSC